MDGSCRNRRIARLARQALPASARRRMCWAHHSGPQRLSPACRMHLCMALPSLCRDPCMPGRRRW